MYVMCSCSYTCVCVCAIKAKNMSKQHSKRTKFQLKAISVPLSLLSTVMHGYYTAFYETAIRNFCRSKFYILTNLRILDVRTMHIIKLITAKSPLI